MTTPEDPAGGPDRRVGREDPPSAGGPDRRVGREDPPSGGLDWRIVREHRAREDWDFTVFRVGRHDAAHPVSGAVRTFTVIDGPDWVNVIALTPEDDVVLVRQFRHGAGRQTVEIPGGMVDPGETPEQAARRELREETGYEASVWRALGVVEPNPALQRNRCFTFLALDARRVCALAPDPGEVIEVERHPLATLGALVARGEITHALVVAALFHLLEAAGGWKRPAAS